MIRLIEVKSRGMRKKIYERVIFFFTNIPVD